MEILGSEIHQVFVKLIDGKHKILNFESPKISVCALKNRIQTLTSIPSHIQLLYNNSRVLHDDQTLTLDQSGQNPQFSETLNLNEPQFGAGKFPVVVHLLLRLRGGKGGFGSLLRGAATKAGQKKTNNFDACRDMSGRRLRHVNAEKKLEEWRAEAEERKLEKMAEEFIKKKVKEVSKSGKRNGGDNAEKYVAKYREDSAKCMEEVERSVRDSIKGLASSKRKSGAGSNASDSKRLKIWMGKRKFGDSDSEDMDEDDSDGEKEGDNEKSVIIDNGSHSDSSKEAEGSSDSITGGKLDQVSAESGSEEEHTVVEESLKSYNVVDRCVDDVKVGNEQSPALENLEENIDHNGVDTEVPDESYSSKVDEAATELPGVSGSEEQIASAAGDSSSPKSVPVEEEPVSVNMNNPDSDKPLNFDEIHSAADLEILGMERLKSELLERGLKCGGTLQERAARLFLLKTTPLEKLPKKLFAKK